MIKPIKSMDIELRHSPVKENSTQATGQFASDKPLVSVIVPAYNAEAYIVHTLNSVLSQTYKNIEVIVVDDGSNDETVKIVESIIQHDDRVTLLRQPNSGVAAARNLAIEKSRGEFIAPIDADDIWYPLKIEKQVHCMLHAGPSTGLVYAWSVHIDERGLLTGGYQAFNIEGDVFAVLIFSNFVGNSSAPLIRRVCIERVGGYSARLLEQNAQGCEDRDLYLRIARFYKFQVVKEFLVGYRRLNSSMSFDYTTMEKSHLVVMGDVKQQYPDIPLFVYRWSRSHYYLYLSGQSKFCGYYWTSIFYLCKAALMSPVFLLYPEFHRYLCASMWRLVKKLAILTIQGVSCPSAATLKKVSPYREGFMISDIVKRSNQPPSGLARLHQIRMKIVQHLFVEKK